MLLPITNTPRPYAWGSTTAMAELFGRAPSGEPEAELWLGAHDGSPSRILEPDAAGGAENLRDFVLNHPEQALGAYASNPLAQDASAPGQARLPFLLKVLAARQALSIQAHPTMAQAAEGYARDNAAGIALDAAERNYKDAYHKPELITALSEHYDALCGFRPVAKTWRLITLLRDADEADGGQARLGFERCFGMLEPAAVADSGAPAALEQSLRAILDAEQAERNEKLARRVVELAAQLLHRGPEAPGGSVPFALELATLGKLAAFYPGDAGILVSLLMNVVRLERGQALFLPAGNIHAYVEGLAVEIMASSDNVLRGGLTPKHIDVPELIRVLDFAELPVPFAEPELLDEGVERFAPPVPDFQLLRYSGPIDGDYVFRPAGPAIALVTEGAFELFGDDGDDERLFLRCGAAAYITPDETAVRVRGQGQLFLATVGATVQQGEAEQQGAAEEQAR